MAGARSVISRQVPTQPDKVFEPKSKRGGSVSDAEQALVTQFVLDQPREVTTAQVTALSRVLRRTKEAVKEMVVRAREDFSASADFYVKSHKTSVERALNVTNREGEHDPKALDVAARASQWALENLSAEGQRIVDKPSAGKGDMGPRIMVGINIGGLNTKPAAEVIEISNSEEAKVPPSF
jgi:hypothetical protein